MSDNIKPPSKATDPGWNDPPMFSYATTPPSSTGKTKLNLNKRVAFPLQSSSNPVNTNVSSSGMLPMSFSSTNNSEGHTVPPIPICYKISGPPPSLPTPNIEEHINEEELEDINEEERTIFTFNTFNHKVEKISKSNETEATEITKRLDILKSSWNELDKIDKKIKKLVYNIAKSIDKEDVDNATTQHRFLVVDHLNKCSQWAPALRKLILFSNLATTDGDQTETPLYATDTPEVSMNVMQNTIPDHGVTTKHTQSPKITSKIYHI